MRVEQSENEDVGGVSGGTYVVEMKSLYVNAARRLKTKLLSCRVSVKLEWRRCLVGPLGTSVYVL